MFCRRGAGAANGANIFFFLSPQGLLRLLWGVAAFSCPPHHWCACCLELSHSFPARRLGVRHSCCSDDGPAQGVRVRGSRGGGGEHRQLRALPDRRQRRCRRCADCALPGPPCQALGCAVLRLPVARGAGLCQEDLLGLRAQLLAHLLPHTEDYIWQRGVLDLRLAAAEPPPWLAAGRRRAGGRKEQQHRATVGAGARAAAGGAGGGGAGGPNGSEEAAPHLWGTVAFGDNLEDEWFVVWLLLELTRAFPVATRWVGATPGMLSAASQVLGGCEGRERAKGRGWGAAVETVGCMHLQRSRSFPMLCVLHAPASTLCRIAGAAGAAVAALPCAHPRPLPHAQGVGQQGLQRLLLQHCPAPTHAHIPCTGCGAAGAAGAALAAVPCAHSCLRPAPPCAGYGTTMASSC